MCRKPRRNVTSSIAHASSGKLTTRLKRPRLQPPPPLRSLPRPHSLTPRQLCFSNYVSKSLSARNSLRPHQPVPPSLHHQARREGSLHHRNLPYRPPPPGPPSLHHQARREGSFHQPAPPASTTRHGARARHRRTHKPPHYRAFSCALLRAHFGATLSRTPAPRSRFQKRPRRKALSIND